MKLTKRFRNKPCYGEGLTELNDIHYYSFSEIADVIDFFVDNGFFDEK